MNSKRHGFAKPNLESDIEQSIVDYASNFDKIDRLIEEKKDNVEYALEIGEVYPLSEKVWNANPNIGLPVGWVNLKEGVFAKKWVENKSYRLGEIVTSKSLNGHYYTCITEGVSSTLEPVFPLVDNEMFYDKRNCTVWEAEKVYSIGDVIVSTDEDLHDHYYKCTIAGVSGDVEPKWTNVQGTTKIDGSCTWLVNKVVKWKESGASTVFRPFGIIE